MAVHHHLKLKWKRVASIFQAIKPFKGKIVHTLAPSTGDDTVAVESLSYHPKQCCLLSTCGNVVKVWKGEDWKQAQETGQIPGVEEKRDFPVLAGYVPDVPRELLLPKQFRKI